MLPEKMEYGWAWLFNTNCFEIQNVMGVSLSVMMIFSNSAVSANSAEYIIPSLST